MPDSSPLRQTTRFDHALRALRALGLIGLLGGLAALSALWAFGPAAHNLQEWRVLVAAMRAIFYACVFSGILILVPVGLILWWRRRAALHGARWFRLMAAILVVAIPALHISARLTSLALHKAVEAADLARAATLWDRLGWLFLAGFVVMLAAAYIAITKPRFGQIAPD